jgi:hypothetical protein
MVVPAGVIEEGGASDVVLESEERPSGAWHGIDVNPGYKIKRTVELVIVEVQHGSYTGEDDIVRIEDDGR